MTSKPPTSTLNTSILPLPGNTRAYTHLAFLGMFLASALLSLTFATQAQQAWLQCCGVLLAVGLHVLVWQRRNWSKLWLVFALLPVVLSACALLVTDWSARVGRYGWLDSLLNWLLMARSVGTVGLWNAHAVGGALAMLLPLQICAVSRLPRVLAIAAVSITVVTAALSGSHAIWLALVIGIISYIMLTGLRSLGSVALNRIWLAGIVLAGLIFVVGFNMQLSLTQGQPLYNGSRTLLWQHSLLMARDFAFTGIGFGNFPMALSSYVLLLHVPFLSHAYQLWINLWLNQGILGLVAWCGLLLTILHKNDSPWRVPALSSLMVVLIYGLIDDPFYGYGGVMLPLLLLPQALLAPRFKFNWGWSAVPRAGSSIGKALLLSTAPLTMLVMLVAAIPAWRSSWHANLGALSQLRTELSIYRWPDFSVQDQLRISPNIDLGVALSEYHTALQLDKTNATANERLGQIELARAEWPVAHQHIQAAWLSAPNRRATQQIMGELYALEGKPEPAAALWQKLDMQQGQLAIRESWYRHVLGTRNLADLMAGALKAGSLQNAQGH